MSVPPYEISIVRLPLERFPLTEAPPKGHSIGPRHAETEAEALALCDKLIRDGYGVEVKGPNGLLWDSEQVRRRVAAIKA